MWDNQDCAEAYTNFSYGITIGEDELCASAPGKDACYVSVGEGGRLIAVSCVYVCVGGGGGER